MSDLIRRFKPAGYLPAPQQARFISTAEEAAKRLPANIKAQSVMNQLQKFGAKPVELEYAGLPQFLAGKGKVSSQDVLAHLQQQGPLGQLKRVDQGDSPHSNPAFTDSENFDPPPAGNFGFGLPPIEFDGALHFDADDEPGNVQVPYHYEPPPRPKANFYQSNVRAPFGSDSRGSYPDTTYAPYTVPGKQGDYTGYREVLLEDPKARPTEKSPDSPRLPMILDQSMMSMEEAQDIVNRWENGEAVNEHRLMLAGRMIEHPEFDPGGVHNPRPVDAHQADYWLRYNNLPDRVAIQNIQSDIGQAAYGPWSSLREPPSSPLTRDNNWKGLMLRHALLESVNQGGKPITLPTGQQMVDVEGFGRDGAGGSADPAVKADRFNEDLANRLMKAMREIHPKGGTLVKHEPLTPPDAPAFPAMTRERARKQDRDFYEGLMDQLDEIRVAGRYTNGAPPGLLQGILYRDLSKGDKIVFDALAALARYGDGATWADGSLLEAMAGLSDHIQDPKRRSELQQYYAVSPEFRDAYIKAVQYNYLMKEMGMRAQDMPTPQRTIAQPDTSPGWTITPHPETVREALRKGVPIMSLAPLLLAPQEEQR